MLRATSRASDALQVHQFPTLFAQVNCTTFDNRSWGISCEFQLKPKPRTCLKPHAEPFLKKIAKRPRWTCSLEATCPHAPKTQGRPRRGSTKLNWVVERPKAVHRCWSFISHLLRMCIRTLNPMHICCKSASLHTIELRVSRMRAPISSVCSQLP